MTKHQNLPFGLFRRALIGLTAAAAVFAGAMVSGDAQTVTTRGGAFPAATYQGISGGDFNAFLGIRYAAAPTGTLRFAPPTAPISVPGTIPANSFGSPCPQTPSPLGVAITVVDDDCLFLNVYVPGAAVSTKNNLPVMVFFHGGFFIYGEGSLYDPADMAVRGNTIVVTVNYRLGILGYMADAALSAQAPNGVSGNYGFRDQLFALKWLQQNIGAFGGNPNNVTIFGEWAGGYGVCAAMVSPYGTGLFQRAITESGPCANPLPTQAGAEALGATIVSALGCSEATAAATVACLRNPSRVSVDGSSPRKQCILCLQLQLSPGVLSRCRRRPDPTATRAGVGLGQIQSRSRDRRNEPRRGTFFVALAADLNPGVGPLSAMDYPLAVQSFAATLVTEESRIVPTTATMASTSSPTGTATLVQQITQEILNEYPFSNYPNPDEALGAVITDGAFSCQANIAYETLSLSMPTFGYEFSDENAPMLFLPGPPRSASLTAPRTPTSCSSCSRSRSRRLS
jgi:para-nitrobenzyl esterase